jgi:hypothetical protein
VPRLRADAGLAQAANVLRETGHRLLCAPEIVGTLAGSRRPRLLRLRVLILRDEEGTPVATPAEVEPALAEAGRVLREQAAIELVPALEPVVATLGVPAPSTALDSPCAQGSWRADFGTGGAFFRRFSARRGTSGPETPVTVFVVRDVLGKAGCSLGPLVDYVTVDMGALKGGTRRVLVHELGHACGLPHSRAAENLMLPKRMGERLQPWQAAVLRSSRHVSSD